MLRLGGKNKSDTVRMPIEHILLRKILQVWICIMKFQKIIRKAVHPEKTVKKVVFHKDVRVKSRGRSPSPDEWEKYVVQIPVVTLFLGEYKRKRRPAGNNDYFKVKKEGFRPG